MIAGVQIPRKQLDWIPDMFSYPIQRTAVRNSLYRTRKIISRLCLFHDFHFLHFFLFFSTFFRFFLCYILVQFVVSFLEILMEMDYKQNEVTGI